MGCNVQDNREFIPFLTPFFCGNAAVAQGDVFRIRPRVISVDRLADLRTVRIRWCGCRVLGARGRCNCARILECTVPRGAILIRLDFFRIDRIRVQSRRRKS